MGDWKVKKSVIYTAIFFSGLAAIIYEIVWQRELLIFFGSGSLATATVIGVFLFGLGLGSFIFGKISEKTDKIIKTYAFLEIGIAIFSIVSILSLKNINFLGEIHNYAYNNFSHFFFSVIRFGLAFLILIIPTISIGGTIPLISKYVIRKDEKIGKDFSKIYFLNSLGAFIGVLFVGFFLIRTMGVIQSFIVGTAINLSIFLGIFIFRKKDQIKNNKIFYKSNCEKYSKKFLSVKLHTDQNRKNQKNFAAKKASISKAVQIVFLENGVVVFSLFLTGFITTSYQILLTRLLSLFGTSNTYIFTVILGGIIFGISSGSFAIKKNADQNVWKKISWAMTGLSFFLLLSQLFFANYNVILSGTNNFFRSRFFVFYYEIVSGFLLSAMASFFLGVTFPLLLKAYTKRKNNMGEKAGILYLINSFGAVVGSFTTVFFLIPFFGLKGVIFAIFLLCLIIFSASLGKQNTLKSIREGISKKRFSFISLVGVLVIILIATILFLLFFSVPKSFAQTENNLQKLVFYEDGISATVTIADYAEKMSDRRLEIDGRPVAGTSTVGIIDAKMLAHIPTIIANNPQTVLTVGYGTGVTSYSMLLHNITVYAVEIEPEVFESSRYFSDFNKNPEKNKKFHIIFDDARNYLKSSDNYFDIIVTDVTGLKYKNNPYLYTVEYFEIMNSKLSERGIAAAWIPLSQISFDEIRMLTASFREVFPHTTMWSFSKGITPFAVLVGSKQKTEINYSKISANFEKLNKDFKDMKINKSEEFALMLLLGEKDVGVLAGKYEKNTDNHPRLEFVNIYSYYEYNLFSNFEMLLSYQNENLEEYFAAEKSEKQKLNKLFKKRNMFFSNKIEEYKKNFGYD